MFFLFHQCLFACVLSYQHVFECIYNSVHLYICLSHSVNVSWILFRRKLTVKKKISLHCFRSYTGLPVHHVLILDSRADQYSQSLSFDHATDSYMKKIWCTLVSQFRFVLVQPILL